MRTVLGLCGDDWMIFKTNENFGGDTITYSLVHITTDGRIQHRESLADSTDPDDRKISLLGFGVSDSFDTKKHGLSVNS